MSVRPPNSLYPSSSRIVSSGPRISSGRPILTSAHLFSPSPAAPAYPTLPTTSPLLSYSASDFPPVRCSLCRDFHSALRCRECGEREIARRRSEYRLANAASIAAEASFAARLEVYQSLSRSAAVRSHRLSRIDHLIAQIQSETEAIDQERAAIEATKEALASRRSTIAECQKILDSHRSSLSDWPRRRSDFHSTISKQSSRLTHYQQQLVEAIVRFYVIKRRDESSCSICGLSLPDDLELIDFQVYDPQSVATALGFLTFVIQTIANYLSIRLPFAMHFQCSTSYLFYDNEEVRYYLTTERPEEQPNNDQTIESFRRALTLLAQNIHYLCIQNGVAPEALRTFHFLPNVLLMLQAIQINLKARDLDALKAVKAAANGDHAQEKKQPNSALAQSSLIRPLSVPAPALSPPELDSDSDSALDDFAFMARGPRRILTKILQGGSPSDSVKSEAAFGLKSSSSAVLLPGPAAMPDQRQSSAPPNTQPVDQRYIDPLLAIYRAPTANSNPAPAHVPASTLIPSNAIPSHFPAPDPVLSQFAHQQILQQQAKSQRSAASSSLNNNAAPQGPLSRASSTAIPPRTATISFSIPDEEWDMIEVEAEEDNFNPF